MRVGLALPHYDYSVPSGDTPSPGPGERPLGFATVAAHAEQAEALGIHSLWVSDHLSLEIEKYGAGPGTYFAYEPLTTLAALARRVRRPRLGTLVLCEALRPAGVLAKALSTLDHLCDGRLDIGIGAGWHPPDYEALGMAMPRPGERLARLAEAIAVLDGLLPGGPFSFEGRFHRVRQAPNCPPARQVPRPPIFVGGKGDRLLDLVARQADGWNTCWVWTPPAYQERVFALERACIAAGRDPATVTRSLGLYALAGEDRRDLERRYERMRRLAPGGMLDAVTLDEWKVGRLVGTVSEVAEQAAGWRALGVAELILGAGPLPFSVAALDDLEPLAAALGLQSSAPPEGPEPAKAAGGRRQVP
jgi:alkanesulfonate monooxygenase SsuD/methylene tetrahydromethanopterin reductase-like flavin-dependent oxidoreductase (luciferase family)